jgi:hypothetical protein
MKMMNGEGCERKRLCPILRYFKIRIYLKSLKKTTKTLSQDNQPSFPGRNMIHNRSSAMFGVKLLV